MKTRRAFLPVMLLLLASMLPLHAQPSAETPAQKDARMRWWREARFGMFIHWGVYAIPARGEWVMANEKIPAAEYEKFPPQFNPVKFNAEEWVSLARQAGMKYIVITSKHHDGFCMWDSKVTGYDIMDATPFKRDPIAELAAACRKEGIRLCLYHSIMDWHHPDATGANFARYRDDYLRPQLRELLQKYGPLGVLWFDGDWIREWSDAQGRDLYNELRAIQPDLIVNNRIGASRGGMTGMSADAASPGDFGTPEQEIPPAGIPGVDWESCMTMNDHWGYAAADHNWKSARELVRNLVDIASKGGNYLLNVGPTAEGTFPPECVERLRAIGAWMDAYGESIHGTQAGPFSSTPWGRCTKKILPDGTTRLYLHIFDWPSSGRLEIPGLGSAPDRVSLLADSRPVTLLPDADPPTLLLPPAPTDGIVPVAALDFKTPPVIFAPPAIEAPSSIFIKTIDVQLTCATPGLEIRYTTDGRAPGVGSPLYTKPVTLGATSLLSARAFRNGRAVSEIVTREFRKVVPSKATEPYELQPGGLAYNYYETSLDTLPAFFDLAPLASGVTEGINLAARKRDENFAFLFTGYVSVPATDIYTFSLESDDGSRLVIDNQEVVDNDGLHGVLKKSGQIALAKGKHQLELFYFNREGAMELKLEIKGPREEFHELNVKDLYH